MPALYLEVVNVDSCNVTSKNFNLKSLQAQLLMRILQYSLLNGSCASTQ